LSILGVYDGHNAGAGLINRNGAVVAAVEEERFSRIKNHDARAGHEAAPFESVAFCVANATDPITEVAFGIQRPEELARLALANFDERVAAGQAQRLKRAAALGITNAALRELPESSQRQRVETLSRAVADAGLGDLPVSFIDHHSAHAGGAFLLSGAKKALVVTLDGKGDDASGSVSVGRDSTIERILTLPTEDSLGHLYSSFTVACGLRPQRDEGKLQAMAAAGNPDRHVRAWLDEIFYLDTDSGAIRGRLNEGLIVGPYPDRPVDVHNNLVRGRIAGVSSVDAAATIQSFLEELVTAFATWHLERSGQRTLVVAGGIFANVSVNRRLADLPRVDELHVHPAMTDAGIALGAAAVATARSGVTLAPLHSVDLGPEYSDDVAARAFADEGYRILSPTGPAERALAAQLAKGRVVARFVGRAEYGPRALGYRSILAPATDPGMPATLNRMLQRSNVMPFAPLARSRDTALLFAADPALATPIRFMTAAVPCTHETRRRYPAIVHTDGTARPQLTDEGALVSILDELERLNGDQVVINTSFNMHDEPMVCRPSDAARTAHVAGIATVQVGGLIATLR
jgi:carbamoyltransferase